MTPLKNKSGSALFIVLGCVALMTLLVVAFLGSSIAERSTANFYAKEINSKLLSESAVNLVLSQLRTATKSTNSNGAIVAWASQPGMIRTYTALGTPDHYFKLYSGDDMVGPGAYDLTAQNKDIPDASWTQETDLYVDLNEAVNSHNPIVSAYDANGASLTSTTTAGHTNVLTYKSNVSGTVADIEGFYVDPATTPQGSSNQVPMPVKWIYILSDGTQVIPTTQANGSHTGVTVKGAGPANPIVGRIAFWTDDETSKVNINTASEGTWWDVPITWSHEDFGSFAMNNGQFTTLTTPCGMDTAIPGSTEYQRTPGHPATTCLSTVLSSILPTPVPPFTETGTGNTYESLLAPYYTLTPRYASGGTKGGTRPSYVDLAAFFPSTYTSPNFVPPAYRLYASADELMFDPQRTPTTLANGNLYTGTGISPTGKQPIAITQQFLNEAQFFLTANSKAPEETLFNTPRISMWPLQTDTHARNVLDNLLAFCATINKFPYYFQRTSCFQYGTLSGTAVTGITAGATPSGPGGVIPGSSQDMAIDMGGSTSSGGVPTLGDPTTSSATGTPYPDTDIHRNLNLMAYLRTLTGADGKGRTIPGFGGNFLTKYPVNGNSGISDIDQILVDMFDYIRSGVNTFSVANNPAYWYSPSGPGAGTSLPIQVSIGGKTVAGLGRTPTIAEVTLVFMPAGFLDKTKFWTSADGTTTPLYKPNISGTDNLPDEVLSDSGTYQTTNVGGTIVPIGSPQTTAMQAFLVIRPIGIMPSLVQQTPNLRIKITGLDSWNVTLSPSLGGTTIPLGFPMGGSAVDLMTQNATSGAALGWGWVPTVGPVAAVNAATVRTLGLSNGDWFTSNVPSNYPTNVIKGNALIYPFVGSIVNFPNPANPSRFGGATGTSDLRPSILPSTFAFHGGPITITISSGFPTTATSAPVVQTINMIFPDMASLPVPSYSRANANDYGSGADGGINSNLADAAGMAAGFGHPAVTDPRTMEFYSQVPWAIDNVNQRIGYHPTSWNNATDSVNPTASWNYETIIARGDTTRSMVLNPRSVIGGDTRVIANMPVVPVSDVNGNPIYTYLGTYATNAQKTSGAGLSQLYPAGAATNSLISSNYGQFHTLCLDLGNSKDWQMRIDTATGTNAWDTAPVNMRSYAGGVGIFGGALFAGATYWGAATSLVTPELTAAQMTVSGNTYPGDWANGFGSNPDGPLIWGPDEGFQGGVSGFDAPYYILSGGSGTTQADKNESFSPNRQVASPVMFGTLPAGVQAGTGWRSLLFCPNPAAGSNHPGFGVGSGTAGPTDVPPFTAPPDHLLLDLFWMPIVQPYAISEPFATAGKVNMNYQIVPFTYIHRSTGVRAVLKSVGLLALPPSASTLQGASNTAPQYKQTGFEQADPVSNQYGISVNHSDNYRYQINLDETIDAADSPFYTRFVTNSEIFRSASEICNIFLVPQAIPGNTYTSAGGNTPPVDYLHTAAWWNNFQLTGLNSRESPYNQIYPRLTTKSNTFQVHYRVQTLVKNHRAVGANEAVFDTSKGDAVGGEYRGSSIIERYVDPNDASLPDFATAYTTSGTTLDNYYRFRIVRSKSFNP